MDEKKNEIYWQMLKMRVWEERIEKVFSVLEEKQIQPIMFKGWTISRFYPNKIERPFSDIDILVKEADFSKAQKILSENNIADVDLHANLGHLDKLTFAELFNNSKTIDCLGRKIRVLGEEDNLRIACVHWLIDGGEYRWKLQDIKYLVERRSAEFEWEKCLSVVSPKRRKWILTAVMLSHIYYQTKIIDLPFYTEIVEFDFIPKWLIESLEKTWKQREIGLVGIHKVLFHPRELFLQIRKRFPPNPIQSTIEIEGQIDHKPRIFYQFANIFWRTPPLFVRLLGKLLRNEKLQYFKW